jgi:arabinose-5-phosphate isomerase
MYLDLIKKELAAEQEALTQIAGQLNHEMEDFLETLLQCQGRIIVCAQAQNQEAGRKTFSTLTQAATPCLVVYNDETFNPDAELIFPEDTLLVLSHQGNSEDHKHLLRLVHSNRNTLTAITSSASSPLARVARRHLTASSQDSLATLGYLVAKAFTQVRS